MKENLPHFDMYTGTNKGTDKQNVGLISLLTKDINQTAEVLGNVTFTLARENG